LQISVAIKTWKTSSETARRARARDISGSTQPLR
jgi:hypothetical protein